jgi:hypothetical protein
MVPRTIIVFKLENTGKGDLKYMELSEQLEFKKMFKRVLSVDLADHPELFRKEDDRTDCFEKRLVYVEDDGTINIIKTHYYEGSEHSHDKDIFVKIYTLKKQMDEKYSLEVFEKKLNF